MGGIKIQTSDLKKIPSSSPQSLTPFFHLVLVLTVSIPIKDQNCSSLCRGNILRPPPNPERPYHRSSLPPHSIIPAYKFAWPVGMDHADDLPRWYQFYL